MTELSGELLVETFLSAAKIIVLIDPEVQHVTADAICARYELLIQQLDALDADRLEQFQQAVEDLHRDTEDADHEQRDA
jgi:hypothetical protein